MRFFQRFLIFGKVILLKSYGLKSSFTSFIFSWGIVSKQLCYHLFKFFYSIILLDVSVLDVALYLSHCMHDLLLMSNSRHATVLGWNRHLGFDFLHVVLICMLVLVHFVLLCFNFLFLFRINDSFSSCCRCFRSLNFLNLFFYDFIRANFFKLFSQVVFFISFPRYFLNC